MSLPRHTLIDLRPDGAFVIEARSPWPLDGPVPQLLGSIPQSLADDADTDRIDMMPQAASLVEDAFRVAHASALGAFFDAVLVDGFPLPTAKRLLGIAFQNLKIRNANPLQVVQQLYEPTD